MNNNPSPLTQQTTVANQADIKQKKNTDTINETLVDPNLDTVRDILFGAQIKQTEQKQAALENHIQTVVNVLRNETQQNFIAVTQDIDTVKEQLTGDQSSEREDNLKRFKDIQLQLDQLKNDINAHHESSQRLISAEIQRLTEQTTQWRSDITRQMRLSDEQLQHDKADKKALAELFSKLSDELLKKEHR